MKIQHNSIERIGKVERYFGDDLLGCLCFAEEDHDYNLGTDYNYSYLIDVEEDNILDMTRVWMLHDSDNLSSGVEDIIEEMMEDLGCERDRVLNFLNGSDVDYAVGTEDYSGFSAGWYVQQSMGLLAHALGYDAAEDHDEQGVVYVVYCVDREMKEVEK